MAKAQYLKQDYERSWNPLNIFEEDFNPANPYGAEIFKEKFQKKKKPKKQKKKKLEKKKGEPSRRKRRRKRPRKRQKRP